MIAEMDRSYDGLAGRSDDVYEALIAAHSGLSPAASNALNARLILLLFNFIDDPSAALEIIAAAKVTLLTRQAG